MSHLGLDAYLCCIVCSDQYAIRGGAVRLVARAEQLRAGAGADGRIGVLPRGGQDVPVYSLSELLGGTRETRTNDRHIVVASGADRPTALLVDRVVRAPLAGARELPLPALAGGHAVRWFSGLLTLDETSCLVLNLDGLRPGAGDAPVAAAARQARPRSRAVADDLMFVFASAALPPCDAASRYAVRASRLAAIVQAMSSVPLPGSAPHVVALGAWRDAAVPLVDFSWAAVASRSARRFAVLRADDATLIALAIEPDADLRRALATDARTATVSLPHIRGVFQSGADRVALLDLERVARGDCAAATAASTLAGVPALV
jgi:chemotaxis signal transduction protein